MCGRHNNIQNKSPNWSWSGGIALLPPLHHKSAVPSNTVAAKIEFRLATTKTKGGSDYKAEEGLRRPRHFATQRWLVDTWWAAGNIFFFFLQEKSVIGRVTALVPYGRRSTPTHRVLNNCLQRSRHGFIFMRKFFAPHCAFDSLNPLKPSVAEIGFLIWAAQHVTQIIAGQIISSKESWNS